MLCTEEGMSGVFYIMNQNPPSYLYQFTLTEKQTSYFDMLDVFVFMKPTQMCMVCMVYRLYMANDKEKLFTLCFLPGKQDLVNKLCL